MCKYCTGHSCENAPATDLSDEDSPDILEEYDDGDDVIDNLIAQEDDELLEADATDKKSRQEMS